MTVDATSATKPTDDLVLRFGGRLVEQLGAQMYPSATATVAELISNAWDADARNVWVEMPFGDWEHGEIVVTDDGLGMNHDEARDAYLFVGRNRRAGGQHRSPGGRLVHGRKGIGKLAAFGTATVLELLTRKDGEDPVSFRLDYDKIRQQDPDIPYRVEPSDDPGSLNDPTTGKELPCGTRIRLTGLRLKRRLKQDQFMASMSRRFALNDREMRVFINGEQLRRFDLDLDVRLPQDKVPPGVEVDEGWAVEKLTDGNEVRWWIGFTPKPLRGEAEQGVSVLVRGKLAQRPFKFERNTGGTTGQLGQEYLVGEVVADWIDHDEADADSDSDYIQSNRDQLQLEDSYLDPFIEWGRKRLVWALDQRNEIRRLRTIRHIESIDPLNRLLEDFPARERVGFMSVAEAVSRLPEVDDGGLVRVMEAVVDTRESHIARVLADQIATEGFDADTFWRLLGQLAELDDRSALAFVEARLDTLDRLGAFEAEDVVVESLRRVLDLNPGLLNPAWETTEAREWPGGRPESGGFTVLGPDEAPRAVIVAVENSEDVQALVADAAIRAPEVGVTVVTANPVGVSANGVAVTSWQQLVDASRSLHEGWAALLRRRAGRDHS